MAQNFTDNIPASSNQWEDDLEDIKDNFTALKSTFSGAAAPSNPVAGMLWADTTNNILKVRDKDNNTWYSIFDLANNKPILSALSGDITGAMIAAAIKDAAAGTASLRTLGTASTSACAGNDSRLSDARTPADLSVTEGKIGAAAVAQAKLKTSTGEVSTEGGVSQNCTLPGGEYGFYPQVKGAGGAGACYMYLYFTDNTHAQLKAYTTNVYMSVYETSGTMYAQQRYVTSSGEINWIFFLRDKKTKKILSSWIATDHPCFGNGGDPQKVAHPFSLHNQETDEIVCINPSNEELAEIKQRVTKQRSLLQVINEDYIIDEDAEAVWPKEAVTVGLPDGYDWQMAKSGDEVAPIKTVIPQPENVLSRKLKLKE